MLLEGLQALEKKAPRIDQQVLEEMDGQLLDPLNDGGSGKGTGSVFKIFVGSKEHYPGFSYKAPQVQEKKESFQDSPSFDTQQPTAQPFDIRQPVFHSKGFFHPVFLAEARNGNKGYVGFPHPTFDGGGTA